MNASFVDRLLSHYVSDVCDTKVTSIRLMSSNTTHYAHSLLVNKVKQ